jgi:hypothetical protein
VKVVRQSAPEGSPAVRRGKSGRVQGAAGSQGKPRFWNRLKAYLLNLTYVLRRAAQFSHIGSIVFLLYNTIRCRTTQFSLISVGLCKYPIGVAATTFFHKQVLLGEAQSQNGLIFRSEQPSLSADYDTRLQWFWS